MMEYVYECQNEDCGLLLEYNKRISEPHLKECPVCKNESLEHVFLEMPHFSIKPNINEVAQLAEANSKKLGKYGVEDKERAIKEHKEATKEQRRRALEQQLPPGAKLVKNQEHKPWYGKLEKNINLNDKKQVDKYIREG